MVILIADPDDIPGVVTAIFNLSCHIRTEIAHPVEDILESLGVSRTNRLMIQKRTLRALTGRCIHVVFNLIDQVLIDRLDPSVVRPGFIRLGDTRVRCGIQLLFHLIALVRRNG